MHTHKLQPSRAPHASNVFEAQVVVAPRATHIVEHSLLSDRTNAAGHDQACLRTGM